MNKSDLVKKIAKGAELTTNEADRTLDQILIAIREVLSQKGKVLLVGFGSFSVKTKEARKGRNPKTGEEIEIPSAHVPTFSPSDALKKACNQKAK